MQRHLKKVLVASGVGGLFSLAGMVAPTGTTQQTQMQAVPAEGLQPGDSFVVSNVDGSECRDGQVTGDAGGIRPGQWVATMKADGDWSVEIEIPEEGPPSASGDPTPFPAGEYEINARCDRLQPAAAGVAAPAQQLPDFDYDPITVTVVPAQETTTTSTPTTEAPATSTTAPPAEAAPTVAVPTYTG